MRREGSQGSGIDNTSSQALLGYCSVTVVVQRDATVYLASIGNLMEDTCDVGLLKCRSPHIDQAASHGLCVDTVSERYDSFPVAL